MANSGFSAAVSYFGSITGLTPKESSDGKTGSVAEAVNAFGDVIAHDVYGQYATPSTTYAVTADVTLSTLPDLGEIITNGTGATAQKVMVTQVVVNTSAGQPPTVTITGQEVPSDITSDRTYALSGTVSARCKAQDVCGAFTAPASGATWDITSSTTTFSAEFIKQSVAGVIKSAGAVKGKIETSVTATDPGSTASLTAASGWIVVQPASKSAADEGYLTITGTAHKFITATVPQQGGGGEG